jgi:hypothetical protein
MERRDIGNLGNLNDRVRVEVQQGICQTLGQIGIAVTVIDPADSERMQQDERTFNGEINKVIDLNAIDKQRQAFEHSQAILCLMLGNMG